MSDYPDWQPNTLYHKDAPASFVNFASRDWVCIVDHRSGAAFDYSLWLPVAGPSGLTPPDLSNSEKLVYLKGDKGDKGDQGDPGPASTVPGPPGPEAVAATRIAIVNQNYNVQDGDRRLAMKGLTASRTVNLPTAASYPVGREFIVFDEDGLCNAGIVIHVVAQAGDLISGQPSYDMAAPYAYLELESDGVSKWTTLARGSVDTNNNALVNALIFG